MAMVFPTSPTVGQVFTSGSRSWVWNGSAWDSPSAINVLQVPIGLEFIRSANFSGAVSHSFGSDAEPVFTSKYDNYKIVLSGLNCATSQDFLFLRLRANTTDLTTSSYQLQSAEFFGSTTFAGRTGALTAMRLGIVTPALGETSSSIVEIQAPMLNQYTNFLVNSHYITAGAGPSIYNATGMAFNSTLYNGFTLSSGSNISGTMSVYGYRK
jgi:hypothetical protein